MQNKIYIQGDVGMIPISSFPKGKKTQDFLAKNGILVKGTHTHQLMDKKSAIVFKIGDKIFCELKKDNALMHEEHSPDSKKPDGRPKGKYEVRVALETDHILKIQRQVAD